ncbi:hypothetical protein [Ornithinimicrobium sp. F0845]|uniref:hypothetical protein n=1 Tax=Ornithinimicrobium sp. F0845 TaxID=2926412 RepID=UPI001FF2777F|nr:hypothetical protein [Ornithinimicrobium sp. F0845]
MVAILVATVAGALSLFLAVSVLGSLFGEARIDPHGYTLIFGSMMLVPTSVVGAFALSFVARRDQVRARRWTTWSALAWVVAALALAGYALSG